MKRLLLSASRPTKQLVASLVDFFSICLATIFALFISSIDIKSLTNSELIRLLWLPLFSIYIFYISGVYKSVLRFIDFSTIYLLIRSIILVFILVYVIKLLLIWINLNPGPYFFSETSLIVFEGWVIGSLSAILLITGSRIFANYYFTNSIPGKRVVIYGAGDAGIQLARALRVSSEMEPFAFVDGNVALHNTFIGGVKVIEPKKLRKLISRKKVDEVLLAMPSASKATLTKLLREIEQYSVKVRILPGLAELAQGKVLVSELKEVDILDLLGRVEVKPNQDLINKNNKDKAVLITGAGGSIGSEISRQVVKSGPNVLVLLDSNEFALYEIKKEIESITSEVEVHSVLANVTSKKRMKEILNAFQIQTIYHSAAYKHVHLVEENPFEAVLNNIIGTKVCAQSSIEEGIETFVLISTDKAVRPTNIMGATKRFSEMILQSLSHSEKSDFTTKMTMVRFGNVIGSSGSAIPLFQQQIKEGGPVTVTDPDVTRYFMSIPEAAELVIQAGAMGQGGDVFLLDMGEPVKIKELAERLIKLSGMEIKNEANTSGDIEITYTGLRPGEKLYEELLIGENVSKTQHKKILRAEEEYVQTELLDKYLLEIEDAQEKNDVPGLKEILKKAIPGYIPEPEVVDEVYNQNFNHSDS